jgi:superfamily I DNA/RNA helicase
MNKVLSELNAEQRAATEASDGPLSIIAGPGTGKTKTLTARIAQLVQSGVLPEQILALTFTNKAAKEMQSRVAAALNTAEQIAQPSKPNGIDFVTPIAGNPRITTFHGLCYELLSDGQPLYIINEADRLELLRELRSQHATELPLREIAAKISLAKNATDNVEDPTILALLQKYNAALREQNRFDFDDLLQELYAKLLNDATFKAKVQSRWRFILVDEFQDTNELQYALLKLLASHDNFFVIGDPLQSIYGFRGATGDIFKRFAADFPNAQQITLTRNYRSTPEIVAASNELFKDAPKLIAESQIPGVVELVEVLNEYREAAWIVQTIEADLGGTDFQRSHQVSGNERSRKFSDYAVLYRTHHMARALKKTFEQSGIPFQSIGDDSPYANKTLRITVAALRRTTLGVEALTPAEHRLLAKLPQKILSELRMQTTPTKSLELAAEKFALIKDDNAAREFQQALGVLIRFDQLNAEEFLQKFAELAEAEFFDAKADAVTLMTVHASKGLEFAHVFVVAVEDGVLPHVPKNGTPNLSEEKRLLYVAMTRAREQLTILHARTRGGQTAKLSSFFDEIPAATLPRVQDPNLRAQTVATQKRKAKNAQTGLF